MNKLFTKTRQQAIDLAKEVIRHESNVNRIPISLIKESSCQCGCGETACINVTAKINGTWKDVSVGICKNCAQ